ncbi:hypothetical protein Bca101_006165 [Brassica carinata]
MLLLFLPPPFETCEALFRYFIFFTTLLQNLLRYYIDVETCEGYDHYVHIVWVLWTERVLDVVVWDLRRVDGIVVDIGHVDVVISKKQGVDVAARDLGSVDVEAVFMGGVDMRVGGMLENSPNTWMEFNVLQVNELSCEREIQKYEEISTIIAGISPWNPA